MPTLAEQLAALIDADRAQPRHYKDAATELRRQHAEIERLRAELAALQEDLRYVAHSGMGSCAPAPAGWQLVPVEPTLDAIAAEFEAAIPTMPGKLLADMIREGVTALRSHIGPAVESMRRAG
jgi:hypothetical protein